LWSGGGALAEGTAFGLDRQELGERGLVGLRVVVRRNYVDVRKSDTARLALEWIPAILTTI
jgi:hypothetical protein